MLEYTVITMVINWFTTFCQGQKRFWFKNYWVFFLIGLFPKVDLRNKIDLDFTIIYMVFLVFKISSKKDYIHFIEGSLAQATQTEMVLTQSPLLNIGATYIKSFVLLTINS